ncbi:SDR family NAD(P)-dependent oxidoreductase, partial [Verminephrobacter sp. Larva24]
AAGMLGPAKPAIELQEQEWDRLFAVNVKGPWLAARAFVPHMRQIGHGAICMFSSTAGLAGSPFLSGYSASKGAVVLLARSLALNHAAEKIRVNCVCPGTIDGPMTEASFSLAGEGQARSAREAAIRSRIPAQFAERQTEATGWAAPDPDGPVRFLMLVKERTESSDIRQSVLHDTQTELAELDALVSAAQGLPDVQSGHNPLRPGNYVRALQQVLEHTGVGTPVRQIWMQQMSEFLGVLLAQEYRNAVHDLYEQGVQPLDYTVLAAPLQSAERERE